MDGVAHLEVILGAAGFGTATSRDTPVTAVSRQCVPTIWANRRHAGQCSEPAGLSETGTRASRSPVVGDVPVVTKWGRTHFRCRWALESIRLQQPRSI